jgi:CBS domain-containing protein
MAKVIVTVPQHLSLRGAARLLYRAEVSAAPVIDANGRCVGDLTASPFVPLAASEPGTKLGAFHECAWSDWQILEEGADRNEAVCEHMGVMPPLVGPETPLAEIVRVMVDENVYRLIIVDAEGVPLGTVSAAQALAAVARGGRVREYGPAAGLPVPSGVSPAKLTPLSRRSRNSR